MSLDVRTDFEWRGNEVKVRGRKVVGKTAYETGLVVEGQAKVLAPRLTGRLAGSITTQSRAQGTDVEAPAKSEDKISGPTDEGEVLVGTAVEYAPYVEFGTVRSGAQPYLRPALDLARGEVVSIAMTNGRLEFRDYLK